MKLLSRICPNIFKSRLAQIFLIANLCICGFASDWGKVFSYFDKPDEKNCQPMSESIEFSACTFGKPPPTPAEILMGFFQLISSPTVVGTQISVADLKRIHPDWCAETFEVLEIILFVIFNSFYWFTLGCYIEFFYVKRQIKFPHDEKTLSIFSS